MPEQRRVVFGARRRSDRLPEWANQGVFIIEWLRQKGLWAEAAERLKVQREGGYAGIDGLMFLTYFFGSGLHVGIKEFSERAREYHEQLAAVGERHWLPTQSSMSRLLDDVEYGPAREFGSWLLLQASDVASVLQHPSVLTRDAAGKGWHVFDWDPTVTTLRQRALPVFDGMPAGRRRTESLAEPGYPGRKRGDVQFSRATLQHAGSGLWLGIEMAPGNGAMREALQSAVAQVVATCKLVEISLDDALLRMDGASGNVPAITACMEGGVHFVTRLAHYQLLEDPKIVRHLNEAEWFEVPSSGSGPTRQAAELGRVTLEPAPQSLQADGSAFAPIETRVVVSRFPCAEQGRGAGVTVDGWHYELYGTDLDEAAWPQTEVVAGYYGRSGQENRFHQEDRELGLDRIFSYNLPGQMLATLVGLFVWNFQTCRGMELSRPPANLPEQAAATDAPLVEKPTLPERPAAMQQAAPVNDGSNSEPSRKESDASAMSEEVTAQPNPTNAAAQAASSAAPATGAPRVGHVTRDDVITALDEVDWKDVLARHDGWSWRKDAGGLQCPANALLPLIRVEQTKGKPIRARFLAGAGVCASCDLRGACIRSDDVHYRKDMRLPIPPPHGQSARMLWLNAGLNARAPRSVSQNDTSRIDRRSKPRVIWRVKPLSWRPPELCDDRPKLAAAPPMLLPAELRKLIRLATRSSQTEVALTHVLAVVKPCAVLAHSAAERQKRRQTWTERLRWNQLPDGSRVELRLLGAGVLHQLRGGTKMAKSA
jgi:hypothetical protein